MFNTNTFHNLANVAIAFVAAAIVFDWSALFSVETAASIVGVLATVKVIINVVRDGLAGMIKIQPPVGSTTVPPGLVVVSVKKPDAVV